MKIKAFICDLDGTLCNVDHRRHLVQNKPTNWPEFYEQMINDTPNEWCLSIVKTLIHLNLIFVTGRPLEYFHKTKNWLERYQIPPHQLYMRPTGDFRDDAIVKEEVYLNLIQPHFDVQFVIDDRKKVVDMWRRNGLVCLQCDEGNF